MTIQPTHGAVNVDLTSGVATYTPSAGYTGTDTFVYNVCQPSSPTSGGFATDPMCTQATVTVAIPNSPPSVEGGDKGVIFRVVKPSDTPGPLVLTDAEHHAVVIRAVLSGSLPAGLRLNPDGTFSGHATAPGSYPIVIEVCDNGTPELCSTQAVVLQVRSDHLPVTGSNIRLWLKVAAAWTMTGAFVMFAAKRRRRRPRAV